MAMPAVGVSSPLSTGRECQTYLWPTQDEQTPPWCMGMPLAVYGLSFEMIAGSLLAHVAIWMSSELAVCLPVWTEHSVALGHPWLGLWIHSCGPAARTMVASGIERIGEVALGIPGSLWLWLGSGLTLSYFTGGSSFLFWHLIPGSGCDSAGSAKKLLHAYLNVYKLEIKTQPTLTVAPGKNSQLPVSTGSRLSSKTICL